MPKHLAIVPAYNEAGAIVTTVAEIHDAAPGFDVLVVDDGSTDATADLARGAVRALGGGRAALIGEHGVLAVGATAREALTVAQAVEHQAQVAWLLRGAASGAQPGRGRSAGWSASSPEATVSPARIHSGASNDAVASRSAPTAMGPAAEMR